MTSTILSAALILGMSATGQHPHRLQRAYAQILPPGPGYGWGFANGNPDGYGWYDNGNYFVLGADRTGEYYFQRPFAVPQDQMFLPTYYNAYLTRGQRYISYAGCGGDHPMGGPPTASATTPINPYQDTIGSGPRVQLPPFSGRVEAPPVNSGGTGLTP
jgi:hypothetical protein